MHAGRRGLRPPELRLWLGLALCFFMTTQLACAGAMLIPVHPQTAEPAPNPFSGSVDATYGDIAGHTLQFYQGQSSNLSFDGEFQYSPHPRISLIGGLGFQLSSWSTPVPIPAALTAGVKAVLLSTPDISIAVAPRGTFAWEQRRYGRCHRATPPFVSRLRQWARPHGERVVSVTPFCLRERCPRRRSLRHRLCSRDNRWSSIGGTSQPITPLDSQHFAFFVAAGVSFGR
jgi:hypothetical protein